MTKTARERFEEKYIPEPNSGCWLWTASLVWNGYGVFCIGKKRLRAHRFAYEAFRGPIPDGMVIDHLCRVRSCVNPDHLEAVTNRENVLRGKGISAHNVRKTHCIHGHRFTEANTMIVVKGGAESRHCRKCNRQWCREKHISRMARRNNADKET